MNLQPIKVALAGENGLLQDTLRELYITFQKAPTLGSRTPLITFDLK